MRPLSPPSPEIVAFARALRKQRRLRDLTQETLAAQADMSSKHLGEIERGLRDPRLSTVLKLMAALDMLPSELTKFWDEALAPADVRAPR